MYKWIFLCTITIFGLSPHHLNAENINLGKIVFANVIFRHGDRTPVDPYPNDPYRNESSWPVPFGQLTNIGKHQILLLGRWLRERYSQLLSDYYSLYDIYIQSTDVDRTLMSAEVNLAGLYPPKGDQVWDKLQWMPIPVHTTPKQQDHILAMQKLCPRYERELKKVRTTGEIKRIDIENKELYAYLTEKTGNKIHDVESLETVYDILFIEALYNKTLPEWTKKVFPHKMKRLAELSFEIQAYNEMLQRLKAGPLLKEMIHHMVVKSKNALVPNRKLWMYSAHDYTIANVLMSLGVFDRHCPPYAATVMLELRLNSKQQYVVTVFYKNSSAEPHLLTLPGCITACPLNQFIKLTKNIIPENWEKECSLDDENHQFEVNVTAIVAILTASTLLLILLVLSIIGFFYWHYKRYRQYHLRYLINID